MSNELDDDNLAHDDSAHTIDVLEQRLKIVSQLLTCAIAKLGGEMAVTTTEIERSVMGQNIALTPLPNDRGYYAALVTIDMPGGVG
jgi:hypothetical protein